jgi:HPt (histidine-containing phosphotransfer) domain-containing protein
VPASPAQVWPAPETGTDHLDLRVIQDDSEGDREFEEQLIHLFIRDARKRLGNLEAAIEGNKADQVHLEAHTVKGICAGIGAVAMGQLAMELEHKGSRGDLSEARGLLDLLRSEYGHVERKLEEYLQPQG